MTSIDEIRARHEDPVDAACALGRGLMRGDRDCLKLGYTARNAQLAATRAFAVPLEAAEEVLAHLIGYADGMRRAARTPDWQDVLADGEHDHGHMNACYATGFLAGLTEDPASCYPATI